MKWASFWDAHNLSIHTNLELPEIDKLICSHLDHSALDAIAGLPLTSSNYQHAIELLCKSFGSKQVIITKHMDTLMRIDPIPSDHYLKDLRCLYDHSESHVCSLQSLGIEATFYGALLSPVLLAKLPGAASG